jgi:hypothetical protein
MPEFIPGIDAFILGAALNAWMAGSSLAMTTENNCA